ncbi:FMN-binding protein [Clostridium gasigenes]|uniref:FMN-binding domain-containing protein n=1 Tax=Clostridium gasigenes TaxID=94869 RepID=A0A1H0MJF2_9CLOT|nr:FMN-binding protein [Clostridium gasigenes]MBB6622105.1 FMN-binding protein [Clostridium gasigenes]MBB6713670.1 FMN-binding protein [Clostridium gasigenes]MBU3086944.1 FMN-binding protein [Clostridium gasigenes]MBU3102631.1 FMN-binding protein [Clostridium gasigenes]MBU3106355.1 FMN-binding protein [Clostridium gasigenes]
MKKITTILATIAISASMLVGCGGGKYNDGTYTGEGQGASGKIKVEVTVQKGKIADIKLVEHNETKTLVDGVKDNVIPEIIKKQSVEGVEAVSGATNSSKGVIEAVNKAIETAVK